MSNKAYDCIRLIGEIAVPVITFATALCTIWNVPHAEAICASLAALDTAIGAIVIILRSRYNKAKESA